MNKKATNMGIKMIVKKTIRPVTRSFTDIVSLLINDVSYFEIFLAGCLIASGFYILLNCLFGF